MKWTKPAVVDILEHHDLELDALETQVALLGEMLKEDLEDIRCQIYTSNRRYDRERVQFTPRAADERTVGAVMACDERRAQYKRDVELILTRIREIQAVYSAIQSIDGIGKATLLNLYYPRRTMDEVAERMGVDRKTIRARRERAVNALMQRFK